MADVDPVQLMRVFENILSNAVKYSEQGSDITIVLKKEVSTAIFSICNKGSNIEPNIVGKIFERYYRSDDIKTQKLEVQVSGFQLQKRLYSCIMEAYG